MLIHLLLVISMAIVSSLSCRDKEKLCPANVFFVLPRKCSIPKINLPWPVPNSLFTCTQEPESNNHTGNNPCWTKGTQTIGQRKLFTTFLCGHAATAYSSSSSSMQPSLYILFACVLYRRRIHERTVFGFLGFILSVLKLEVSVCFS